MDQFSIGLSKTKPNCNSIKGKKDFACTRANYTSPNYAVIPKECYTTKPEWSFNISKIQSSPNGEFKFGSNLGNNMGDQCGQRDNGDPLSDY